MIDFTLPRPRVLGRLRFCYSGSRPALEVQVEEEDLRATLRKLEADAVGADVREVTVPLSGGHSPQIIDWGSVAAMATPPTGGSRMRGQIDGINRLIAVAIALLTVFFMPLPVLAQDTAPAPVLSANVFKSFYRPDVTVNYRVTIPPEQLPDHRLIATLTPEDGTDTIVRREISPPEAEGSFSVPTGSLQTGRYVIDLALESANGARIAQTEVRFPQLSDPTVEQRLVSVRPSDNMLIVEGRPHFPIGIYQVPSSETQLRMLADAGFNLVLLHAYASPHLPMVLDTLQDYGMRAWGVVSSTLDFSTNAEDKREKLTRLVELVGDHPGLLVWESFDEPAWGDKSAEGLYDGYCFLRELDQQHAVWTNHAPRNTIAELAHYNRATDIAGADIYPVPEPVTHSNLPNDTISVVGDETEKNIRAVNGEKPVFMVLQGFGWRELSAPDPDKPPVMPTFEQSRFMAYDAIVHGANGILYWGTARTKKPSRFWSELRSLVSELSALQDVLAAETVRASGASIRRGAGVRMLHKRVNGLNYLILVNENPEAVDATVKVPPMGAEELRWLYEGHQVPIVNGTLTLTLDGYGVAVLTDDRQFSDERRDYSDEWQNAPEVAETDLSEPGNEVRNPGFEIDANGNGLPDAWESLRMPLTASMSTDTHSGEYAFRFEGVGGDGMPTTVQRPVRLTAGERYRLSGWVRTDPADVEFRFYTEWVTDGKFHPKCLPWTGGTTEWTEYSLEFEATPDPAGRAYVVLQIRGSGAVLFDDMTLEPVQ